MIQVHGMGPLYWGVEHDSVHPNRRVIARAFLVESLPPWRRSTHAVRLRLGKRELHIGLCKPGEDPETLMAMPYSDMAVAVERGWDQWDS